MQIKIQIPLQGFTTTRMEKGFNMEITVCLVIVLEPQCSNKDAIKIIFDML